MKQNENPEEGILCIWNPSDDRFARLDELIDEIDKNPDSTARGIWSVAQKYKQMQAGKRVFLLRLGVEPKGLVGSGRIVRDGVHKGRHYDSKKAEEGLTTNYIDVLWDFLSREPIITKEELLQNDIGDEKLWRTQGSGVTIKSEILAKLEDFWNARRGSFERDRYRHLTADDMTPVIGVAELAGELSDLLINLEGDAPILIGVFGKWGRGKTFLFKQIWNYPKSRDHFYRVDFHAWKFQKTPALWGYLYEAIALKYYDSATNIIDKRLRSLRLNWNRESKWDILYFLTTFVLGAFYVILQSKIEVPGWLNLILGGFVSLNILSSLTSALLKTWEKQSSKAKEIYRKYTKKLSYAQLLGIQAEVQKELKVLMETWIRKDDRGGIKNRVLLFVDDLDRCSEGTIIEVVDSLRVMLEDETIAKRMVVVVAVDESILKRAISLKYDKLFSGQPTKINKLTREYFDKLFLASIKLGKLNKGERETIFDALTRGKTEKVSKEIEKSTENTYRRTLTSRGIVQEGEEIDDLDYESFLKTGSVPTKEKAHRNSNEQQKSSTKFEISVAEREALKESISNLDELTPRQIRIFYLRYVLGRDFLKSLKKLRVWTNEDIKVLCSMLEFLNDKDVLKKSVSEYLEEEYSKDNSEYASLWKRLLIPGKKENFLQVLEIVVPY